MGIYLGNTELGGGGGGGTPVGGFSFFNTPSTTTFTDGQEVYTDPDNSVWIKSNAIITYAGSGALDASAYPLVNQKTFLKIEEGQFSTNGDLRLNRYGITFTGKHILLKGYNGGYNDYLIYDVNGTLIDGPTATSETTVSTSQFHNSTHTFILSPSGANFGYASSPTTVRYLLTSSLTDYASYTATPLKTWSVPSPAAGQRCAITNRGESNERYWWKSSSSQLSEHTFNPTAADNTNPWTATGNTISTSPVDISAANPVAVGNTIYIHTEGNLSSFDATTFKLIKTIPAPGNSYAYQQQGQSLAIIPDYVSASTKDEFLFTQATAAPASVFTAALFDTWENDTAVIGPTASGSEVFLTDGTNNIITGRNVPMWQRIA